MTPPPTITTCARWGRSPPEREVRPGSPVAGEPEPVTGRRLAGQLPSASPRTSGAEPPRRRWTRNALNHRIDCMVIQTTPEPAPLDRVELERSLLPFGQSRMLPRAAYVDAAVFEWEQRNFFDRDWACVARSEDVAEPGDQRAE